ncbi:MAG: acetate--CoA ligase family protein [Chloroflexota bacterium]
MESTDLNRLFHPTSVAVVGVSTRKGASLVGGQNYLNALRTCGFRGHLYAVNPHGGEIWGLSVYRNVVDIPGPVDYVIASVPAAAALDLMRDCITKGVRVVHFFTSGFSEVGGEGERLEKELCSLAREHGVRVIGPNCMGVYCPSSGLCFVAESSPESGPVGLVCQSGGNAIYMVREGGERGVRFSKVISYGNACDVTESDVLDYLAADAETRTVLLYIEGVRDGQRFKQALKQVARRKPTIVLKAGTTETGARAATSHTGALSGTEAVWNAYLRQVGAVRVEMLDDLLDMAVTFCRLRRPDGRRVAILGIGGGATVLAGDACGNAGLLVPRLPEELGKQLGGLLKTEAGTILNNPIDLSAEAWRVGYSEILRLLDGYDGIDMILVHFSLGLISPLREQHREVWTALADDTIQAYAKVSKPVIAAIQMPVYGEHYEWMLQAERRFGQAGIPSYRSIAQAARAVDRFLRVVGTG